jgi:hypothetical protein
MMIGVAAHEANDDRPHAALISVSSIYAKPIAEDVVSAPLVRDPGSIGRPYSRPPSRVIR